MPAAGPLERTKPRSRNGGGLNHEAPAFETPDMTPIWRVLTRNLGWKLLSVSLAVLLWIAVEGEPVLVTVQSVPVYYRNVEPALALVSNPPVTVRLELRGSSDVLGPDNLSSVAVLLDLAGETGPGDKAFPIARSNVSLPAG